jgi:hypothetical protein
LNYPSKQGDDAEKCQSGQGSAAKENDSHFKEVAATGGGKEGGLNSGGAGRDGAQGALLTCLPGEKHTHCLPSARIRQGKHSCCDTFDANFFPPEHLHHLFVAGIAVLWQACWWPCEPAGAASLKHSLGRLSFT